MARWVITNSDGSPCDATIDDNGLANIPENTGDTAITYWVRYFDDEGCSAGTYYSVDATIIKCDETDYEVVDLGLPRQAITIRLQAQKVIVEYILKMNKTLGI